MNKSPGPVDTTTFSSVGQRFTSIEALKNILRSRFVSALSESYESYFERSALFSEVPFVLDVQ